MDKSDLEVVNCIEATLKEHCSRCENLGQCGRGCKLFSDELGECTYYHAMFLVGKMKNKEE